MTKYGQIVLGPAGCGKSTYCRLVQEYCLSAKRKCVIVNLDPGVEKSEGEYDFFWNITDFTSIEKVMEELDLGPNGALVYCMEELIDNFEWIQDELLSRLSDDAGDEYVLFDCPGQIELYSHLDLMQRLTKKLNEHANFRLCSVFCIDSTWFGDATKIVSGMLTATTAMLSLSLPHVNIITKGDLTKIDEDDDDVNDDDIDEDNENEDDEQYSEDLRELEAMRQARIARENKEKIEINNEKTQLAAQFLKAGSKQISQNSTNTLNICKNKIIKQPIQPVVPVQDILEGRLDIEEITQFIRHGLPPKFKRLNQALSELVNEANLAGFSAIVHPLREETVEDTLARVDHAIQYGEEMEPKLLDNS